MRQWRSTATIQRGEEYLLRTPLLFWRGKEFIDSNDHGRLMQTAVSLSGNPLTHQAECFNPTEGGNGFDNNNPGQASSSILEGSNQTVSSMATQSKMAFFLIEGQVPTSPGCANNAFIPKSTQINSNFTLNKHVSISHIPSIPHAIRFLTGATTPTTSVLNSMQLNWQHIPNGFHFLQYENTAVYLKSDFNSFYRLDLNTGVSHEVTSNISAGSGREYDDPVYITTANGDHALGIYSPDLPEFTNAGYSLFDLTHNSVAPSNKLNCVFRHNAQIMTSTIYSHVCYVAVGNKQNVEATLMQLHNHFN